MKRFLLLLILTISLIQLSSGAVTYSTNLDKTLFYKFNQASGTSVTNLVNGVNNGTYSIGTPNYVASLTGYGNATSQTGEMFNTTFTGTASQTQNFTLEWRMKTNQLKVIMDWGFLLGNGFSLAVDGGGKMSVAFDVGGQTNSNGIYLNDSKWHHIVVVRQDSNWQFWEDGVNTFNKTSALGALNTPLEFGYDNSGYWGGAHYSGQFDQVILWNRTLTASEILSLNNSINDGTITPSVTTSIVNPQNGISINTNGQIFNVSSTITAYNFTNTTFYIWDTDGNLINQTTKTMTGNVSNSSSITITGLNELGRYTLGAKVCGAGSGNVICTYAGNITVYTYISLRMLDDSGNDIVTGININCTNGSANEVISPYRTGISRFGIGVQNCTFTDTEGYYAVNQTSINFSYSQIEYNVTLSGQRIRLSFYDWNGNPYNATGYWTDGNATGRFNNQSLIMIQRNLVQGRVKILFGYNTDIKNYTGFYEYNNDWITGLDQNITVITANYSDLTTSYIRIMDESGNLIDDALVRASFSNPYIGGTYKLFGQRYSGSSGTSGLTYYIEDPNNDVSLIFSKDGYRAKVVTFDPNTEEYPFNSPLDVRLYRNNSLTLEDITLIPVTQGFTNRSKNYTLTIYAPDRSIITFNTDYRMNLQQSAKKVTLDELKIGKIELVSNEDFSRNSTSSITLYIYADGTLWGTIPIEYKSVDTSKFNQPSGISSSFLKMIAWASLIIISSLLGYLFRTNGEESGTGEIGATIFISGCLILWLFVDGFGWLTAIAVMYFALIKLKKYITE